MEKPKKELYHPPKQAQRFLLYFLKEEIAEEVQGDLDEMFYYRLEKSSPFKARIDYWFQVANYLRPFAIRHFQPLHPINFAMYRHFIKISLRQFAKNKVYLLVNTLGLGIALACCIVAYMFFAFNFEFDRVLDSQAVEDIVKVHAFGQDQGGEEWGIVGAPLALGPTATADFAGIQRQTRFLKTGGHVLTNSEGFQTYVAFADTAFFDLFPYPLQRGDYQRFKENNYIFLAEKMAQKLFADQNPIGKSLRIQFDREKYLDLIVGGVLQHIPANSTFNMEAIIPFENYLNLFQLSPSYWGGKRMPSTFFELSSPSLAGEISKQLDRYLPLRNEAETDGKATAYELEPFLSYFTTEDLNQNYISLRINSFGFLMFAPLAFMILLIACFNLTNISIATTARRVKEIGVRKAIGAARKQIFTQFLLEIVLSLLISSIFAYFISQVLAAEFTSISGWNFRLEDMSTLNIILTLIFFLFVSAIVAGTYPAWYNSRLKPAALVKGTFKQKGTGWFSRTLICLQFSLSVCFLITGVYVYQNFSFQDELDFGYKKDNLLTLSIEGEKDYNVMKPILQSYPEVVSVGATASHVGMNYYRDFVKVGNNELKMWTMQVGDNYLETMEIPLVAGRYFHESLEFDRKSSVIVNREFLRKTGLKFPVEVAIEWEGVPRKVVGVVDNHIDYMQRTGKPEPFLYLPTHPEAYKALVVNTSSVHSLPEVQTRMRESWKKQFPLRPFNSQFQDEIASGNDQVVRIALNKIFLFLTALGSLLSLSGIFALATLNVSKRTKEIGIRKIMGANVNHIVGLVNREFVYILSIAVGLGAFGGPFLSKQIISSLYDVFPPSGVLPVLIGGIIIFAIGLGTTSLTILRTAVANPVDSLRSE